MVRNNFVLNNFSKISETFYPKPPANIKEQLHKFILRNTNDSDFTEEMKKDYIIALLTGAVCTKKEKKNQLIANILMIEQTMIFPIMHIIECPCSAIVCQYDTFRFILDEMFDNEPEWLLEIATEVYERVYPNWLDEKDIGFVLDCANHFWEPMINDILLKYSGCEAKCEIKDVSEYETVICHALTALLRFGKSGYFGVSFPVIMASIGIFIPPFPKCIKENTFLTEIYSRIMSANGIFSTTPSMLEEYNVLATSKNDNK